MAELIKKSELVEKIWERHDYIGKHPYDYENNTEVNDELEEIVSMANGLPTVTEAEIRAKAIDEFAERLKDFIVKQVEDAESSNDLCTEIFQSEIDEIAEQLKEEQ